MNTYTLDGVVINLGVVSTLLLGNTPRLDKTTRGSRSR